ncbi:hypothetical protein NESM_000919800 [Novymonas esmeraldas]|uniref:Transmembrane protein n=1 Tax=Novymonas esmeraldas TaxID=1808958 RepID=A0AAW0F2H5_9TRYP
MESAEASLEASVFDNAPSSRWPEPVIQLMPRRWSASSSGSARVRGVGRATTVLVALLCLLCTIACIVASLQSDYFDDAEQREETVRHERRKVAERTFLNTLAAEVRRRRETQP